MTLPRKLHTTVKVRVSISMPYEQHWSSDVTLDELFAAAKRDVLARLNDLLSDERACGAVVQGSPEACVTVSE